MANNKNRPQGSQDHGATRAMEGARDQIKNMSQNVQEGVDRLGDEIHDRYDSAREGAAQRYRQTEGMIARNPAQSVMIGFGVGFGLGVLLTVMLTQREETWMERVSDRVRDLPDQFRNRMPDSIARHFS
ncbi:MAG: hypothetical protein ABI353_11170 [Isosphaeraceae bacterium]